MDQMELAETVQAQAEVIDMGSLKPFAQVDQVSQNSPASAAGFREGDLVIRFENVDHSNHRNLAALGELVPAAAAEQKALIVIVSRSSEQLKEDTTILQLSLTPRPWGGRGLVGCHIRPYSGP
mmetsp:Transcript_32019/g.48973  ORF Transcript_32019/g.48973 Transcript_32019/m.48973 type:complete len:123 (+) Transcript_32019:249-617(+)